MAYLGLAVVLLLLVLFAWLTRKAWRARHAVVKWAGGLVAGLLTLVLALTAGLGAYGLYLMLKPYPVLAAPVKIESTPEQVARGEHIAAMVCASCHSTNGNPPLSGGNNLADDSGMPIGDIYPPNITPGGVIAKRTDEDLYRVLRTGVRPDGRVTAMAALDAIQIGDDDAKAVIAYLRRQPAIEKSTPEVQGTFLLALLTGAGLVSFPEYKTLPSIPTPPKAADTRYGEYLVSFMDCRVCHNSDLAGGAPPPNPPGPNLTLIVPKWSKDDFFKAMRTGVDPNGNQISPLMPWKTIGKLEDVELEALYRYLNGLTPIVKK